MATWACVHGELFFKCELHCFDFLYVISLIPALRGLCQKKRELKPDDLTTVWALKHARR